MQGRHARDWPDPPAKGGRPAAVPSRGPLALITVAGTFTCAIPLEYVSETMRPLPTDSIANPPAFVLGLALIRGTPIPVVDLATLLGDATAVGRAPASIRRFVALEVDDRRFALAVDRVVGVHALDPTRLAALPPLLQSGADPLAEVGVADSQLLVVLRASRLIPDDAWDALSRPAEVD